jgi:hypothetical protein
MGNRMIGGLGSVGRTLAAVALVLLLAACGRTAPQSASAPITVASAPGEPAPAESSAPSQVPAERTLAYEHTVAVELSKETLSPRTRELQSACASRAELGCTLLDISLDEQSNVPSAHITMRLAPGQVDRMVEIAARNGRVLSRRTHGEDLAQPLADTDRQISLLSTHRDRLNEFLKRPDLKVEQVFEVSKAISTTQAEIESLTAAKANLQRRVDTERLTLDLFPPEGAYAAAQTPVGNALRSFGENFSITLAALISFIAVILPVVLLLAPITALWWWWSHRAGRS